MEQIAGFKRSYYEKLLVKQNSSGKTLRANLKFGLSLMVIGIVGIGLFLGILFLIYKGDLAMMLGLIKPQLKIVVAIFYVLMILPPLSLFISLILVVIGLLKPKKTITCPFFGSSTTYINM